MRLVLLSAGLTGPLELGGELSVDKPFQQTERLFDADSLSALLTAVVADFEVFHGCVLLLSIKKRETL